MSTLNLNKKKVSPDKRGRVSLKGLVEGIDGFEAEKMPDGTIILRPFVQVKPNEAWLFNNQDALNSVLTGIQQAKNGQIKKRKSYSDFAEIEID